MKQFKLLLTLFFLSVLGIGQVWGETYSFSSIPTTGWTTKGGNVTINSIQWQYSSATYVVGSSSKIQIGSKNNPQTTDWTIQTPVSSFGTGMVVTSVSITAYTTATTATYDISVGGTSVKSGNLTTSSSSYSISDLSVSNGNVVITLKGSSNSKAMYLSNITVTYQSSGKTALATPTNLSTSNLSDNGVDLTWNSVSNAESYIVEYKEQTASVWTTINPNPTTNSCSLSNLSAGATYSWRVSSVPSSSSSYSTSEAAIGSDFTTTFTPQVGTYSVSTNNSLYDISTGNNATEQSKTKYGITIVSGCESSATTKTYYDTDHIRYYEDSYMKLTAPTGYEIFEVVFSAKGTWNSGPSVSVGTYTSDTKTWTGSASQVNFSFSDQNRIGSIAVTYAAPKTLSSIAVSGTPTKTTYDAGEALDPAGLVVTGTYADNSTASITEGIIWTLDPKTLSAGVTTCDVMASVGQIMSDVYTVTGLTVNAAKTLIGIEAKGTPAEFWKGDTFNNTDITITATWSDESEEDVTSECSFSTPDMSTAGQKTVTVTYKGETTTYKIDVKTIENTQATAYTVEKAKSLIDAGKDLSSEVYVKGVVSEIVTAWSSQYNNISYDISDDGETTSQQFRLYRCKTNGAVVGDFVIAKGTMTKYGSTYEFAAGNTIVANTKATTLSIANISVAKGEDITPVITTNITGTYTISYVSSDEDIVYAAGDEMRTATKTGTATITATISANGYKTAATTFTVTVTSNATLSSIAISGDLTKSTYTVGDDFDFFGLTATGTYSDASTADLTGVVEWSATPSTMVATTKQVMVKATSGEISGTKAYAVTVSKKTPTITIANIELGIEESKTITATTTPEDATLSYSVTEGSDKVNLNGSTITGKAIGTSTINASFAGNDEYAAMNKTFTVTVTNIRTATKSSFASGDNSGSHNFTNNTDISFEAFKGNSATAPAINSSCLRLYQGGSYVAISGVKGVKIQSITITTGSTYESTTVGYCVDNGDAPTTGETVAKSSEYTINGLNNQEVEIYCLGTNKDTRLDIASIVVKYTKETITLSSIAVSGEYETSFIKNAEFNHAGAVVKATYSDGDEQDVTSSAVFSEPDMTSTGEKTVTISYTHEGVEKTTSYNITISEEIVTSIALSGTYTKVFKTTDTFNHTGAVVTATYNSGRSVAVEDAEFSTPDLSTTGTKTVTVTYAEKTATYVIKVIPATAIFFESFDDNDGTGGNDDKWSGSIAASDIVSDNKDWTFASAKGAKQCAKFGTGSAAGSAKTPTITLTGAAKITFKAAAWNGNSEELTLNLSVTSGTLSQTSVEMTKAAWNEYTVYITGVETSTQITFAASQSSNNRFFLDEVLVEEAPSSVTLVAQSGSDYYATFSNSAAVQFTDDATEVYTITVADNKMTLNAVDSKKVPANTGVLIKSTSTSAAYAYLASADDLGDNALRAASVDKATLANHKFYKLAYKTYDKETQTGTDLGFYYGAANGAAFTSREGSAYLAVSTASGAPIRFVFNEENEENAATAVENIEMTNEVVKFIENGQLYILRAGKVYNAQGQLVK